jgi:hypothetical protein
MTITCVHAEEDRWCAADDNWGNTSMMRIATWRAGSVTAGEPTSLRVAFDSPDPKCAGVPCLARGGIPGVELRRIGSSVCIGVPGKGKLATMFGWIPATRWHATGSSPQPAGRWVGVWQNETAKITVQSTNADQLAITGHAVRGSGTEGMDFYGDFQLSGKPVNGVLAGPAGDSCEVAIRLLGEYLVVEDNNACGGMGVTFAGMYRLRHH